MHFKKKPLDQLAKQLFLPVDSIALSALFFLFGLAVVIWPDLSSRILLGVVGIAALAVGGVRFYRYCQAGPLSEGARSHLTISLCFLVFGLVLLLMPAYLQDVVPFCIGLLLLVGGIIKLQVSLEARKMQSQSWKIIVSEAAFCVILGTLVLINPFSDRIWLIRFLGLALMLEGIMDVIANLLLRGAKKAFLEKMRAAEKGNVEQVPSSLVEEAPTEEPSAPVADTEAITE